MAKILVVSKYYYPFSGGIEESVKFVAEYAARFHDVTVVASNHEPGNKVETLNGVRVVRRHVQWQFKGQPICLRLFSGIRFGDYDMIHFHSPNPLANVQLLLRSLLSPKTPVVVTHHMDIFGRKLLRMISLPFLRHLIRSAVTTIVTSRKNLTISKDLPHDANYVVVPLAITPQDYQIDADLRQEAAAWREGLSGTAPVVGFVGRHARYKGLTVLMEALAQLDGVHGYIGGDGPYRAEAQARAEALGIADRVHFLGRLSHREKLRLLASLDVFAFPSTEITEAFGISQLEAMICGAPVVASNLQTGVTDVSIGDKTALLATPGDADSLAQQLLRLIEDKELAARLSKAALAHVNENMTHDIVSKKTLGIFEGAIATKAIGAQVSAT
ncbi:glycosyltransferase [Rhizobium sp. CC-YZS058]|uniref:glycosyltransferase n=1 Tax=Rhizobium sp. CC-YZS058 TaxID=3042153 RepID=UPI002B052A57|nr:glycosyltransferase [Rhizobium sp. CC-YZS058]MEA3535456.1 glycosyltransferase [Rhizobium sp. CC-YZS058]